MQPPPPGRSAEPADLWRLQPTRRLHWREWGGDSVVYDESTGETHQFSPLAAAVMAWLEERPHSAAELTAAIANDLGSAVDEQLLAAVAAALEQFVEIDWIEPLNPA